VALSVPDGWTCERLGPGRFRLFSEGPVTNRNQVRVELPDGSGVEFTVLGPGEAQGFAAGANVQVCPRCHARVDACICED